MDYLIFGNIFYLFIYFVIGFHDSMDWKYKLSSKGQHTFEIV